MTNVNMLRTDAHKPVAPVRSRAMPDNLPKAMREQAMAYFQLAALTKIPELAQEFRAKGHVLLARAVLIEREIGHPVYFALV